MQHQRKLQTNLLLVVILSFFLLTGCKPTPVVEVIPTDTSSPILSITDSPTTPVELEPIAVIVNGEGISLEFFNSEVARYTQALTELGKELPLEGEVQQIVLDSLIDQLILAQAARVAGYEVTETMVDERISDLVGKLGDRAILDAWMAAQGYTEAQLRYALKLEMGVVWQRNILFDSVPTAVEQVRARQIFAYTEAGAERAMTNLNSGVSFDDLAWEFNPDTGGELGWFPRGYLTVPEVEEVAFSLPVGVPSHIIESQLGYHIILVLAHEMEQPLATDALQTLQRQAVDKWLESQRTSASIEVLLP